MRFPFGRGARQREIDGLRQRIAELQDEITRLQENLAGETPDVETTDAYRSVQLLRESMRREELITLHQELSGLEARLATLTADLPAPRTEEAVVASPPPEAVEAEPSAAGAEAVGEPEAPALGRLDEAPSAPPAIDRGLPSERAIIEPQLPPPGVSPEPLSSEPVEAEAEAAPQPLQPVGVESAAAAEAAETPEPAESEAAAELAASFEETGEEAAAATEAAAPAEPEGVEAPEEAEPTLAASEAPGPAAEEPSAAPVETPTAEQPTEAPEPAGAGATGIYAGEAAEGEKAAETEAPAEVEAEPAAAPPAKRRNVAGVLVTVLLLVGFIGVVAVAALESGILAQAGIVPGLVPTAQPTLAPPTARPATAVPTATPPPTLATTLPPSPVEATPAPAAAPAVDRGSLDLSG